VANVVEKLGLIGKPLGAIGDVFEIERMMMAMDMEEARRKGVLPDFSESAWEAYEEEPGSSACSAATLTLTLGSCSSRPWRFVTGYRPGWSTASTA